MPQLVELDAGTIFIAGSAARGTNMPELWRLVEACAATTAADRALRADSRPVPMDMGGVPLPAAREAAAEGMRKATRTAQGTAESDPYDDDL